MFFKCRRAYILAILIYLCAFIYGFEANQTADGIISIASPSSTSAPFSRMNTQIPSPMMPMMIPKSNISIEQLERTMLKNLMNEAAFPRDAAQNMDEYMDLRSLMHSEQENMADFGFDQSPLRQVMQQSESAKVEKITKENQETFSDSNIDKELPFPVKNPHVFYANDRDSDSFGNQPMDSTENKTQIEAIKANLKPQSDSIGLNDPALLKRIEKEKLLQLEKETGAERHLNEFKEDFAHEWTANLDGLNHMGNGFQSGFNVGNLGKKNTPLDINNHPPALISPYLKETSSFGKPPLLNPILPRPSTHPGNLDPRIMGMQPMQPMQPLAYQCCRYVFPEDMMQDHMLYMLRNGGPFAPWSGPPPMNTHASFEQDEMKKKPIKAAKIHKPLEDLPTDSSQPNDSTHDSQAEATWSRARYASPFMRLNYGSCVPVYQIPMHLSMQRSVRKTPYFFSLFKKPFFG